MGITIEIPGHLWQLTDDSKFIEVNGTTIRECLLDLARKHPGMLPELFDLNGKLAVIVLKGDVSIDDRTIDTAVRDGERLGLFPIIVGG